MFEKLFTSSKALDRYSNGPLLEDRVRYLVHCAAQGSTRSSLRLTAQHQLVIIEYLRLQESNSVTVKQIEAAAELWISRQLQPHTHNAIDYRWARLRSISETRQWLSFLGRLRPLEIPRCPYANLIEEFADYMLREKGLSQHTVRIRCWHVEQFLRRFWEGHRSFDEVTITDIDAAVARKGAQDGYARTSIQSCINSLRAFSTMPSSEAGAAPV